MNGVSGKILVGIAGMLLTVVASAGIDSQTFEQEMEQARYQQLVFELRCPKCQNQNIGDSNAPIAQDMREVVAEKIRAGESDEEIVDFLVERYGEFVHYRPRLSGQTAFLWFGPAGFILVGVIVLLVMTRRRRAATEDAQVLSDAERTRLDAILNDQSGK